jgi:hypothetical protein
MKKFIYIFIALFLGISQANAQEIYVDNFTAPEGGLQTFDVKYKGIGKKTIMGYIFKFEFPEGLSLATDDKGKVIFEYGEGNDCFDVKTTATGVQASPSDTDSKLSGETGTLLTLTLKVTDPLKLGDKATVNVFAASLTEKVVNEDTGLSSYNDLDTDPFTFDVTIVENIVTLDENSTIAPEAAENVKVKMLRTINAGNWGTICLPFAMTEDQVKSSFGENVKFADFTGYEAVYDGRDVSEIKLNFSSVDASAGLAANHPCLIYVENKVEQFTVDKVNIVPVATPKVEGTTGQRICDMVGLYVKTENMGSVRAPYLFISGNNFYYATGKTTMKAFRAYFDLYDVLTNMNASAKIGFSVDDEATSIDGLSEYRIVGGVYDLSGRKIQLKDGDVTKLQKGVYIIDGKKVTIK